MCQIPYFTLNVLIVSFWWLSTKSLFSSILFKALYFNILEEEQKVWEQLYLQPCVSKSENCEEIDVFGKA